MKQRAAVMKQRAPPRSESVAGLGRPGPAEASRFADWGNGINPPTRVALAPLDQQRPRLRVSTVPGPRRPLGPVGPKAQQDHSGAGENTRRRRVRGGRTEAWRGAPRHFPWAFGPSRTMAGAPVWRHTARPVHVVRGHDNGARLRAQRPRLRLRRRAAAGGGCHGGGGGGDAVGGVAAAEALEEGVAGLAGVERRGLPVARPPGRGREPAAVPPREFVRAK